jgi:hypothetical protein
MQLYPYPATTVTRLALDEWVFSLRAGREVLIGYSIKMNGVWELFGNDQWVMFTGAVESLDGAVQIVAQWAERENIVPRDRVWHWVHWRNPGRSTTIVRPFVLLSPGASVGELTQGRETTVRKHVWTIGDVASDNVTAIVPRFDPADGGEDGRHGDARPSRAGLQAAVVVRPLHPEQRVLSHALDGDARFLPVTELDTRIETLVRLTPPRDSS